MPAVSVHAIARTASAPAIRGDSEALHARASAPATRARSSQMKSAAPASATAAGRSHERERTRMPGETDAEAARPPDGHRHNGGDDGDGEQPAGPSRAHTSRSSLRQRVFTLRTKRAVFESAGSNMERPWSRQRFIRPAGCSASASASSLPFRAAGRGRGPDATGPHAAPRGARAGIPGRRDRRARPAAGAGDGGGRSSGRARAGGPGHQPAELRRLRPDPHHSAPHARWRCSSATARRSPAAARSGSSSRSSRNGGWKPVSARGALT